MTSAEIMINFLFVITLFLATNRITGIIGKPVKSIKTEYGAIYDCVDFYKQSAFQHPLLKNHSFHPQMRPSSMPEWMTFQQSNPNMNFNSASYAQFKKEGCTRNTVPIRRVNKKELHQANWLSKNLVSQLEPGIHRAIVQTKSYTSTIIYKGLGASLSIWNPYTEVDQYSSAQILIQNGPDSIQVGWTVNQMLNKDNGTHVFIHTTTADGTHCFNTLCPGYVIVRSDIPPDIVFSKTSTKGGEIDTMQFFIYRDEVNGNWWLCIGGEGTPIGFWPSQIFDGLSKYGSYLACGGETYSPPNKPEGPPMGTGSKILGRGSVKWDAFCANLVTVNEDFKTVDLDYTEEFSDSHQYDVKDVRYEIKRLGHTVFFGGPGR